MAVCEKCEDTGLYEEEHDGGAAELTCNCPVGVAKQNAYESEHPETRPLDDNKNVVPRRYLGICPQCKRNEYMAVADKVCERCKEINDATQDLLAACKSAVEDLKLYCEDCNLTGQACEECSSSEAVSECVKAISKEEQRGVLAAGKASVSGRAK